MYPLYIKQIGGCHSTKPNGSLSNNCCFPTVVKTTTRQAMTETMRIFCRMHALCENHQATRQLYSYGIGLWPMNHMSHMRLCLLLTLGSFRESSNYLVSGPYSWLNVNQPLLAESLITMLATYLAGTSRFISALRPNSSSCDLPWKKTTFSQKLVESKQREN